ncbi:MAG: thymidine phosphorylase [Paracoccus sp. (in: a-proteobacteria)]|uniref:thymidine phosphorylase n=1 Tax=Paracoccus sp. TaxID=267 RepID=UPI0026DF0231|nr:thymidine phosphorylase [Paracoccus sp. (in: a-proteobacteria)]MDO5612874.1 thymidine phosphorylase [Paracoccus sp. (in: a-proteobacteria)]
MTDARSIIAAIRDGRGLDAADARWFARGLADGSVDDAQAGAFAMAVFLRGLDDAGRVALTQAMRDSGQVLTWDLPGPVVDKHSTGGVGDTVSLILAPALAACGAYVPMISGRGLGHTGGTLDKMEAIPGYRTNIDRATLNDVLRQAGCAIIGATDDIAPADRRLYAIRDISGTVESIDLITASILSKKLAAGLDALVLDVKCGSGAFMPDQGAARALARSLVDTAQGAGCRTMALITDMSSPLARSAGNAVEVCAAIEVMTRPDDNAHPELMQLTCILGGEALALCSLADTPAAGQARIMDSLRSGQTAERFARMVAALGGPADLIDTPHNYLKQAGPHPVPPAAAGHVAAINTRALGELVVQMGGGRLRSGDRIEHGTSLTQLARVGDVVAADASLGCVCTNAAAKAQGFARQLQECYRLSPDPVPPAPLILDRITA